MSGRGETAWRIALALAYFALMAGIGLFVGSPCR